MADTSTEKPRRKHLNAAQKRALRAAEIRRFVQQYGRGASPGYDPDDRSYDREVEQEVRRMSAEELDRLMRDDEEWPCLKADKVRSFPPTTPAPGKPT